MAQCQDKAFRRISELKDQIDLDQLVKRDVEKNYTLMLEEKDELVKVLKTQVSLVDRVYYRRRIVFGSSGLAKIAMQLILKMSRYLYLLMCVSESVLGLKRMLGVLDANSTPFITCSSPLAFHTCDCNG